MADTKIEDLTELTERREADYLVINEESTGIVKKIKSEYIVPALMLSDYDSDLADAVSDIGAGERTLIINKVPDALAAHVTIPSTLHIHWLNGCVLDIDTYTLTINGPLTAGNYQLFSGTGTVAGSQTLLYIPADWFAGTESVTMTTALAAADIAEVLVELGIPSDISSIAATAIEINTACDGSTAKNSHTHLLAVGCTDVTATVTEVNNKCDSEAFVNDSNGNPTVSDTEFAVDTTVTEDTWESVGPTGGGQDYTWTALNSVPSGADWIEVKIFMSADSGTISTSPWLYLYARAEDGITAKGMDNMIARMNFYMDTATSSMDTLTSAKIPVSSRAFDLYWDNTGPFTTISIDLWITGYGYNPA